jgi:hypothetical protein
MFFLDTQSVEKAIIPDLFRECPGPGSSSVGLFFAGKFTPDPVRIDPPGCILTERQVP